MDWQKNTKCTPTSKPIQYNRLELPNKQHVKRYEVNVAPIVCVSLRILLQKYQVLFKIKIR